MNDTLSFGYQAGVPADHTGALWGARLIFPDDLLYDRQSNAYVGDADEATAASALNELHDWINGLGSETKPLKLALAATRTSGLRSDESREVVLYEDERGKIVGNPNASYGYLYVVAFLKAAQS